jgi:hypothetical protein
MGQEEGDEILQYEAKCPLCNHNDENQAHIMLRCDHPAMKYWRDKYFRKCNIEIQAIGNKGTKDHFEGLWTWIAQPQEEGEDTSDNIDRRKIALMMGRPIQEDLVRPGSEEVMTPGQIKPCKELCFRYGKSSSSALQRRGAQEAASDPHPIK